MEESLTFVIQPCALVLGCNDEKSLSFTFNDALLSVSATLCSRFRDPHSK